MIAHHCTTTTGNTASVTPAAPQEARCAPIVATLKSHPYPVIDGRSQVIAAQRKAERKATDCAPVYRTRPERADQLRAIRRAAPGTERRTHLGRMLQALLTGSITTLDAREHLGVSHPSGRVGDLIHKMGLHIIKIMVLQVDDDGEAHRFAQYSLVHGAGTA